MKSFKTVLMGAALSMLIPCAPVSAFAEDTAVTFKTDFGFVLATTLEMKAKLIESVRIPLFVGEGPLFSGNNITFKGIAGLSPVSVTGHVQVFWTPIAFLQLYGEAGAGTGWNIPIATGLALTVPSGQLSSYDKKSFGGCLWNVKGGATVQFDFAALFPGDWNHVVFQSSHELNYRAFTGAAEGQAWCFENNDGEDRNGWNYYGNVFVGYQMPIFLNTAGILVESEAYLYNTAGGSVWGDALPRWVFGPLLNFRLTDRLSIAVLAQMRTRRTYTYGDKNTYYAYRVVDQSNPLHLEMYRAAINLVYHLK